MYSSASAVSTRTDRRDAAIPASVSQHRTPKTRHRFHAICPYFAMFPESFAETWIERLTRPGDTVLDPFCGRGTTPFQALLMGRSAIACDVNPVAYCVTRAKTNAPARRAVRRRLTLLKTGFEWRAWETSRQGLPEFFDYAFDRATLRQLLHLRSALRWATSNVDALIAALVLGSLHGESNRSPTYLSNQMPRTISTKPAYSVRYWQAHGDSPPKRDVFALLNDRLEYRYETPPPSGQATILHTDMRDLPRALRSFPKRIGCAITSPPYLNVTNFEEDQWLRLWFLGGPPQPTYGLVSRDDRHERPDAYWGLIADMWRVLGAILSRDAHVVIRLGGKGMSPEQIPDTLKATAVFANRKVKLLSHELSQIKKRQTDSFRPGSTGCRVEVDCHFVLH